MSTALTPHERSKRHYELAHSLSFRSRKVLPTRTELDILLDYHQFIHSSPSLPSTSTVAVSSASASTSTSTTEWEQALVLKYYDSLFREYALVDLKRYKTGSIALRWRTEDEVIEGRGERTCGGLRCEYHLPSLLDSTSPLPSREEDRDQEDDEERIDPLVPVRLTEFQVPFTYAEEERRGSGQGQGEGGEKVVKRVLVKVILCERCSGRLNYVTRKRKKEDKRQKEAIDVEREKRKS